MSIYDRVMLIISAILTAISSVIVFFLTATSQQATTIGARLHSLIYNNFLAGIFLGIIVVLIIFYLFLLAFRTSHSLSSKDNSARSVVKPTSMGDVRIALSAIEELVMKVAKKHPQVKDAAARVGGEIDTIQINVRMDVHSGVAIPALCEELEQEISEVVQQMIGIEVKAIHFDINSVSGDVVTTSQFKNTIE